MASGVYLCLRLRFGAVAMLFVVEWAVLLAAAGQTPARTETTVRDGVYSADQAKRGRTTYGAKCATCHDGGTMGPELAGDAFMAQHDNKSVRVFYNRIMETMPADDPGSMSEAEILDVIAYVLQMNRLPPGDADLASAAALDTMKFVSAK